MIFNIRVNDSTYALDASPTTTLLSLLRDELGLRGTRFGCGLGACGACYVLLDGEPMPACTTTLAEIGDRRIQTIEGLADGEALHPVQRAFLEEDAMQCGYCTSGMIISAVALLARTPEPSDDAVRRALAPHLCRCGIYGRAIRAVRRAIR